MGALHRALAKCTLAAYLFSYSSFSYSHGLLFLKRNCQWVLTSFIIKISLDKKAVCLFSTQDYDSEIKPKHCNNYLHSNQPKLGFNNENNSASLINN